MRHCLCKSTTPACCTRATKQCLRAVCRYWGYKTENGVPLFNHLGIWVWLHKQIAPSVQSQACDADSVVTESAVLYKCKKITFALYPYEYFEGIAVTFLECRSTRGFRTLIILWETAVDLHNCPEVQTRTTDSEKGEKSTFPGSFPSCWLWNMFVNYTNALCCVQSGIPIIVWHKTCSV